MAHECWSGDHISGFWVCAICFHKLAARPARYGMESIGDSAERQTMTVAPVATVDGDTLGMFVRAMALRLVARTGGAMHLEDAADYALDLLRAQGVPFGDPEYAWDRDGAWELVDEDMHYWDVGEGRASNA